jgi:hypothetical protein
MPSVSLTNHQLAAIENHHSSTAATAEIVTTEMPHSAIAATAEFAASNMPHFDTTTIFTAEPNIDQLLANNAGQPTRRTTLKISDDGQGLEDTIGEQLAPVTTHYRGPFRSGTSAPRSSQRLSKKSSRAVINQSFKSATAYRAQSLEVTNISNSASNIKREVFDLLSSDDDGQANASNNIKRHYALEDSEDVDGHDKIYKSKATNNNKVKTQTSTNKKIKAFHTMSPDSRFESSQASAQGQGHNSATDATLRRRYNSLVNGMRSVLDALTANDSMSAANHIRVTTLLLMDYDNFARKELNLTDLDDCGHDDLINAPETLQEFRDHIPIASYFIPRAQAQRHARRQARQARHEARRPVREARRARLDAEAAASALARDARRARLGLAETDDLDLDENGDYIDNPATVRLAAYLAFGVYVRDPYDSTSVSESSSDDSVKESEHHDPDEHDSDPDDDEEEEKSEEDEESEVEEDEEFEEEGAGDLSDQDIRTVAR